MMKNPEGQQQLPPGFVYAPDFLTGQEERELLNTFGTLPFASFDFHGYIARRRIVEYGLEYDFGTRKTTRAEAIPQFLIPLRERAARVAELPGPNGASHCD